MDHEWTLPGEGLRGHCDPRASPHLRRHPALPLGSDIKSGFCQVTEWGDEEAMGDLWQRS